MDRKQWYCFMLFLPDMVPCIVWIAGLMHPPQTTLEAVSFSGAIYKQIILWVNYVSLPYIGFAAIALYRAWEKTADQMVAASWILPVFFMPLYLAVFNYVNWDNGFSIMDAPMFSAFVAFGIIFVGYIYVLVAHAFTWAVDSIGWLEA